MIYVSFWLFNLDVRYLNLIRLLLWGFNSKAHVRVIRHLFFVHINFLIESFKIDGFGFDFVFIDEGIVFFVINFECSRVLKLMILLIIDFIEEMTLIVLVNVSVIQILDLLNFLKISIFIFIVKDMLFHLKLILFFYQILFIFLLIYLLY